MNTCPPPVPTVPSAFAGFFFPPDVIVLAVRCYLRFGLSYRDVEELLAERGVAVDHVTIYRWVQRFTPLLAEAARPCRHGVGNRWQVDETYVKVAGKWRYVYRAIDQFGQVIDVFVTLQRDAKTARRLFEGAFNTTKVMPMGGQYRPSGDLPGCAGGTAAGGLAPHRAARQQPGRGRSRPPEVTAATDAGTQAGPLRQGHHRRPCLRAERPARPL